MRLLLLATLAAARAWAASTLGAGPIEAARGVLIYAVNGHYLEDGALLVESIRRHNPTLAILYAYAHHSNETDAVARVITMLGPLADDRHFELRRVEDPRRAYNSTAEPMARLRLGRMDLLASSPFALTLYVDADALVCRDLTPVFDMAGDRQWSVTLKTDSPHDRVVANEIFGGGAWRLPLPPESHPYGNAGLVLYRPFEPEVKTFLRTWRTLYAAGLASSGMKKATDAPAHDQFSHWLATSSLYTPGLRLGVLDDLVACRLRNRVSSCVHVSSPSNLRGRPNEDKHACFLIHGHKLRIEANETRLIQPVPESRRGLR